MAKETLATIKQNSKESKAVKLTNFDNISFQDVVDKIIYYKKEKK